MKVTWRRRGATYGWIVGLALTCAGCVTQLPPVLDVTEMKGPLAVGRVVVVLTGDRSRIYGPVVRSFEVEDQKTHERFNVEILSDDRYFAIALPPGDYRLNRVQISEGPFMSMAQVNAEFSIAEDAVTYLGTWRFGVDSPGYGRMVALSMVMDQNDQSEADAFLTKEYPAFQGTPVTVHLPEPSNMEMRLYEVMPYPRYPRYFQRHVW